MKHALVFVLLFVLLTTACVTAENTEPQVVTPVLSPAASVINLQYGDDSGAGIDVQVTIREMTIEEFKQSDPQPNVAVYADGHDQVAYLWVTSGGTYCTEGTQANMDFFNFEKFYEITLPDAEWWDNPIDAILVAKAMDQYLEVPNGGLCVFGNE